MSALARRFLLPLAALAALVPSLGATWSIVVVNRRTGEVCVASATCIVGLDLSEETPVILVGYGAGVTQATLDNGENKLRIWDGFHVGDTPAEIMARVFAEDPAFNTRQIGIVDLVNTPLSFTGNRAGQARGSAAGVVDDIAYAIQGNVLASRLMVGACEQALRNSRGDTAQRVMAAMVVADQYGGDGRCSCGAGSLGDCGIPPPGRKSAHCGFVLLARVGDLDGDCALNASCAGGEYHLELNIKHQNASFNSPDPVEQLVTRFATWRANRANRPDGLLSRVHAVERLPADGVTERTVTIELVDLDGNPLDHGGVDVQVASVDGAPTLVKLGPVVDHGDGTYSFVVHAGDQPGIDRLAIRAKDSLVRATLYPYLELRSDAVQPLHAGRGHVSAAAPESVPFVVQDPTRAGASYWLVARFGVGRALRSTALLRTIVPATSPFFPAAPGVLDALGRAEASYAPPPGLLASLVGLRVEWTARFLDAAGTSDSNVVGFAITP